MSAGGAGALTVWLAAPPAFVIPWVVGSLVVLGAVLGYRYGRGVVRATGAAFLEAAE